ncbi:unnamed protein product [Prorocentrum cordatum]|uniref:Uncharacterized protein n=1 Tax=Prorocentrum cordatum TaxID=2364126 RepID=A0ABN9VLX3_9DINO|nr:unnamed protein product [Polarella glacialis]
MVQGPASGESLSAALRSSARRMARDAALDGGKASSAARRSARKAAAASAERAVHHFRAEAEGWKKKYYDLAYSLGSDRCPQLGPRLAAAAPALEALLLDEPVEHTDVLRRNVALHSVAEGIDIVTASPAELNSAQRGPRLGARPPCVVAASFSALRVCAATFVPGAAAHHGFLDGASLCRGDFKEAVVPDPCGEDGLGDNATAVEVSLDMDVEHISVVEEQLRSWEALGAASRSFVRRRRRLDGGLRLSSAPISESPNTARGGYDYSGDEVFVGGPVPVQWVPRDLPPDPGEGRLFS